jgi:hypothetical protein
MTVLRNSPATVRFRTPAAREWTDDPTPVRLPALRELARDLRYDRVEG